MGFTEWLSQQADRSDEVGKLSRVAEFVPYWREGDDSLVWAAGCLAAINATKSVYALLDFSWSEYCRDMGIEMSSDEDLSLDSVVEYSTEGERAGPAGPIALRILDEVAAFVRHGGMVTRVVVPSLDGEPSGFSVLISIRGIFGACKELEGSDWQDLLVDELGGQLTNTYGLFATSRVRALINAWQGAGV